MVFLPNNYLFLKYTSSELRLQSKFLLSFSTEINNCSVFKIILDPYLFLLQDPGYIEKPWSFYLFVN